MRPLTVVVPYDSTPGFLHMLQTIAESSLIEEILVLSGKKVDLDIPKYRFVVTEYAPSSGRTIEQVFSKARTRYLLLLPQPHVTFFTVNGFDSMLEEADSTKAGIVYSDYLDKDEDGKKSLHPLNDYQAGSVRDDFDFGGAILFSVPFARDAMQKYGPVPDVQCAGIYDLRLKVSIDHVVHHISKPLYSIVHESGDSSDGHGLFAYVDPLNASAQREMEAVFTDYLKSIRAYLPSDSMKNADATHQSYPVVASVIIPVLNRKRTVSDAIESAFSQETHFPFNVIVVDNHSTDGTTEVLQDLADSYGPRMQHIIPARTDLGIGGCWNEALHSDVCGRYAVQLDSDDLYGSPSTLRSIVDMLRRGSYAMVVGSYTLVNERLEEIPPGLIDHHEWTDENGHNNALRINGLGAPRAFDTALMRKIDFLNVSYGEDYAACLRICREYRIGRIFESLYLCRRWSGNTDAALSMKATNRNNAFKDSVRTEEIRARQEILKGRA